MEKGRHREVEREGGGINKSARWLANSWERNIRILRKQSGLSKILNSKRLTLLLYIKTYNGRTRNRQRRHPSQEVMEKEYY